MTEHDDAELVRAGTAADEVTEDTEVVARGGVAGEVNGLVWHDDAGVDVISVTVHDKQIAIPVPPDEWRTNPVIVVSQSIDELDDAPSMQQLEAGGGTEAIRLVSTHFEVRLAGPPPGPSPTPLPPWWKKGVAQAADDTSASGIADQKGFQGPSSPRISRRDVDF